MGMLDPFIPRWKPPIRHYPSHGNNFDELQSLGHEGHLSEQQMIDGPEDG